jgi:hypothetical protein
LCSLSSERNELEQTSSASAAVLWAAVVRRGTHFVEHNGDAKRGDLPGGFRTGQAAADDVHCLKAFVTHGTKIMRVTGARQCLRLYRIYGGQYGSGPCFCLAVTNAAERPSRSLYQTFRAGRSTRRSRHSMRHTCSNPAGTWTAMIEPSAMDPAIALLAFVTHAASSSGTGGTRGGLRASGAVEFGGSHYPP